MESKVSIEDGVKKLLKKSITGQMLLYGHVKRLKMQLKIGLNF